MATERQSRQRTPAQTSLLRASDQLGAALARAGDSPVAARAALRDAIIAVESRIQSIAAADGIADSVGRDEPRLLPALEHIEADLARLLLDSWEATAVSPAAELFTARLETLADEMRRVADSEFAILAEAENSPAGLD
ncbi:MAG: hypothetical protein IT304_07265 [Dehalococcoidia bacterium]|nr:hypothetical protein [Dehalococcoidia bacterium]